MGKDKGCKIPEQDQAKQMTGASSPCGSEPKKKKSKPYKLSILVKCGDVLVDGANVSVSGSKKSSNKKGVADFGKKPEGDYDIKVEFGDDSNYLDLAAPVKLTLNKDTKLYEVKVEKKSELSAKIEMEYKVVLMERLSSVKEAADQINTDNVTRIEIKFERTKDIPYDQDARLTVSGAGAVDMFSDEDCKTAFDGTLKNVDIEAKKPIPVYLKAKTKGAIDIKVDLKDAKDKKTKVKEAQVKASMNVVEIEMKVYQQDESALDGLEVDQDVDDLNAYHTALKDKKIPDQKAMSDSDKVKKARLLHVQKDKNHGRAKVELIIAKADWNSTTDEYKLFFRTDKKKSGDIKIWDKEFEGAEHDIKNPIKIADLKADNGKKTFWIEGTAATDKKRELALGISLDRPTGGIAKKPKEFADWAMFTIVQIEKVEIKYQAQPNTAVAWDTGEKKFYINFKTTADGRKVKIGAKLTQKIDKVKIHFMFAGDHKNRKKDNWGVDMPSTWKWSRMVEDLKHTDRTARKKVLHKTAETDAEGYAEVELTLSKFGGDKLTPACYINEDPHLAKYIHEHAELKKKVPVLCTDTIQVWRKFWIQPIRAHIMGAVGLGESETKFTEVNVTTTVLPDLVLSQADIDASPQQAIYPEYMVKAGGGNGKRFVGTDYNMNNFFGKVTAEADKPMKVPMLVCQANFGDAGVSADVSGVDVDNDATHFPVEVTTSMCAITPLINDATKAQKLLASGSWTLYRLNNATNAWDVIEQKPLLADDVVIDASRSDIMSVHIRKPTNMADATPGGIIRFDNITINGCEEFVGGYFSRTKTLLSVFDSTKPHDFHNTVAHELGHAFFHVMKPADSGALGVEDHPLQEDRGQGNHCNHQTGSTFDCIMYYSSMSGDPVLKFCELCRPYHVVGDFSRLK